MSRVLRGAIVLPICCVVLPLLGGCGEDAGGVPANGRPPGATGGPPAAGAQPDPAGGGFGPNAGPASGIRQVMATIGRGPNALTNVLGRELNEAQPPWETIQTQSRDYARLATELGKQEPRKGSKESWSKLTTEFAGFAAELDRAAQAKAKNDAVVAHDQLKNSCNSCHREHRMMGRGMGGPGGFGPPGSGPPGFGPQGFGPPGSGPPGGPPSGPPGGQPPR